MTITMDAIIENVVTIEGIEIHFIMLVNVKKWETKEVFMPPNTTQSLGVSKKIIEKHKHR